MPGGEWPLRSPFEEGEDAIVEVLGDLVVLKGWARAVTLHEDLFTEKDRVDLTRERLTALQRPAGDVRAWFRLKEKTAVYARPATAAVGEVDRGTAVTLNRKEGRFAQIRFEPDHIGHKSGLRIVTMLWVAAETIEPIPRED